MSLTGCTVIFLLLGMITQGYTEEPTLCNFTNYNVSSNDYTLDVSPQSLYNNTEYMVTVNGTGHALVLLQSLSNNTFVGTWSEAGILNCAGGPMFNYTFEANNSLVVNWTSPNATILDSVNISVSITNGTGSYMIVKTLNANSSVNSGSSMNSQVSMYLAIIQTLGLLMVTSKLL